MTPRFHPNLVNGPFDDPANAAKIVDLARGAGDLNSAPRISRNHSDGEPMITIRELLNRIRWDREYGRGEFAIGYFDRLEGRIIMVPLGEVRFDPDDHFSFQLNDAADEPLSIPLHRVREVYRNGELIWHRRRFPSRKDGS